MNFLTLKKAMIAGCVMLQMGWAMDAAARPFGKPLEAEVLVTQPSPHAALNTAMGQSLKKKVMLMNFPLSQEQRKALFTAKVKKSFRVKTALSKTSDLPAALDIGMNDVPVLDQGMHGSCVTFAATAAVDAVLGKGDYVSQLCQLELGDFLERVTMSYIPGGWDGSIAPWVLDQMMRYGIVSKETQQRSSCAGITEYPLKDNMNNGNPMSTGEFSLHSEPLIGRVFYSQLMSYEQRINAKFTDTDHAFDVLSDIKHAIVSGHRVMFSTFVVMSPYCGVGACAKHNQLQDTWALTDEINTPPYGMGGHEMVITGFDDNGTATDSKGNVHTGLLVLRNSWGETVGDNGNYYMTYDYFVKFVTDAHEVGPVDLFY